MMYGKVDHSHIAGENVKWHSHCRKIQEFLLKTEHVSIIQPRNCTPEYLSQSHNNINPHRNPYANGQKSFIYNGFIHKPETTQMAFDR